MVMIFANKFADIVFFLPGILLAIGLLELGFEDPIPMAITTMFLLISSPPLGSYLANRVMGKGWSAFEDKTSVIMLYVVATFVMAGIVSAFIIYPGQHTKDLVIALGSIVVVLCSFYQFNDKVYGGSR